MKEKKKKGTRGKTGKENKDDGEEETEGNLRMWREGREGWALKKKTQTSGWTMGRNIPTSSLHLPPITLHRPISVSIPLIQPIQKKKK